MLVSSRKEENVRGAVERLEEAGLTVAGQVWSVAMEYFVLYGTEQVCHVGKAEDRARLLQTAVDK